MIRSMILPTLARAGMLAAFAAWHALAAAQAPTSWNRSADAAAPYGRCVSGATAFGNKLDAIGAAGEPAAGALAIKVLHCQRYGGGAGWRVTPCPGGLPYDVCVSTGNDGQGQAVTLGVLRQSKRSNPNAPLSGCPDGLDGPDKLALVQAAGQDPRRLTGIYTLRCEPLPAAQRQAAVSVEATGCPVEGHDFGSPFGYCLRVNNDGAGHAAVLGVVTAHGANDPYALYGECDAWDIRPGFSPKSAVLEAVGRSLENVRGIDVLSCAIGWGLGGDFPSDLRVGPCHTSAWVSPRQAARHDYCVWGTDRRGNGLVFGVSGS